MVGTVKIARPGAPQGRAKDDDGQEKEDAGHLKPQNAAYAAKGAQKAAYAACDTLGRLCGCLTGGPALGGGVGNRADGPGHRGHSRRGCAGCGALAGDASGNPQANAQGAADGVRFHSIYDGSSVAFGRPFSQCMAVLSCPQPAPEVR